MGGDPLRIRQHIRHGSPRVLWPSDANENTGQNKTQTPEREPHRVASFPSLLVGHLMQVNWFVDSSCMHKENARQDFINKFRERIKGVKQYLWQNNGTGIARLL